MSLVRTEEMFEWERDMPRRNERVYVRHVWSGATTEQYSYNPSVEWQKVCAELGLLVKDEDEAMEVSNFIVAMLKMRTAVKAAWEKRPDKTRRDGYFVDGPKPDLPVLYMFPVRDDGDVLNEPDFFTEDELKSLYLGIPENRAALYADDVADEEEPEEEDDGDR